MLKGAVLLCLAGLLWDRFYNDAFIASTAGHVMWEVLGWSSKFASHVVPT